MAINAEFSPLGGYASKESSNRHTQDFAGK
jgi:hypothetical protein